MNSTSLNCIVNQLPRGNISLQSDSIDLSDARMLLDKAIQENELVYALYMEFKNAIIKVLSFLRPRNAVNLS